VLEAIVEDARIKQSLYQHLEPRMKPNAVLATNTSGIPMDTLSKGLKHPERLVGIHFFNPVAKMKLVEVIAGSSTSEDARKTAFALLTRIRKLPLPVKSTPGFLVNRVLMPYLMEAVHMVEEGIPAQDIDRAALDFGMPMGPIALADKVGLDICLAVARDLSEVTGDTVPDFLHSWVSEGRLGIKSGYGFYRYAHGRAIVPKVRSDAQTLVRLRARLIERLVQEAKRCLKEGVVADAELLDAGMVFGAGFAPFRGGVMKYVEDKEAGIEIAI